MKPALLILDPQNDFFGDDNPNLAEFQTAVPTINAAIALFRQRGWPVIFVQHSLELSPRTVLAELEVHPQ
jgi:nicotinamidase-related amidase